MVDIVADGDAGVVDVADSIASTVKELS